MAKVTINPGESDFKPFDLVIRVETEEELAVLWAIFNASQSEVMNNSSRFVEKVTHYFNSIAYVNTLKSKVWNLLNARIRE